MRNIQNIQLRVLCMIGSCYLITGCKRKQVSGSDNWVESLAVVLDRAEERAVEREERMHKLELEIKDKIEREDRRDLQFMSMFSALLQQIGQRPPFLQSPFPYQSSQYPIPFDCLDPSAPRSQFFTIKLKLLLLHCAMNNILL